MAEKIRMLKTAAGPEGVFAMGSVQVVGASISKKQAKDFVDARAAELIIEPKKAEAKPVERAELKMDDKETATKEPQKK